MPKIIKPLDEMVLSTQAPEILGSVLSDDQAMALAFKCAWQGIGRVSPNPMVGAVLLDSNRRLLATGAHLKAGQAHAEINLLNKITDHSLLKGSQLFVTLEPCSHQGKTPPCADALLGKGIKKINISTVDPNPKVSGRGVRKLRQAGMEVVVLDKWADDFQCQNRVFIHQQNKSRPFVGLKAAVSLGGNIARRGDRRRWITSERSRRYGHFLRLYYDAIMIGQNTLLADNPSLLPYLIDQDCPPVKVVLDPDLKGLASMPLDSLALLTSFSRVFWITEQQSMAEMSTKVEALTKLGVSVQALKVDGLSFLPQRILENLGQQGIQSVLLEGGAGLYSGFLESQLVDRIHYFQAPTLELGSNLLHAFDGGAQNSQISMKNVCISLLDDDWLVEANLAYEGRCT
jgi:diaminohydroxyphosphoribosylaminopyrimidine deaminase / 5-amino-6-(5-phosphoribosylamino)uracil reductase